MIAKLLRGRTDTDVRNHWKQLMKKQSKEDTMFTLLTPHVSTSQPSSSSSSLPSEVEDTMEAKYVKTNVPPKFIDFLGVGDS